MNFLLKGSSFEFVCPSARRQKTSGGQHSVPPHDGTRMEHKTNTRELSTVVETRGWVVYCSGSNFLDLDQDNYSSKVSTLDLPTFATRSSLCHSLRNITKFSFTITRIPREKVKQNGRTKDAGPFDETGCRDCRSFQIDSLDSRSCKWYNVVIVMSVKCCLIFMDHG